MLPSMNSFLQQKSTPKPSNFNCTEVIPMKARFSSVDLIAIIDEIKEKITNLRLQNIYDVSNRFLLFKFHRPDSKEFLLVESGVRMHLTKYSRESASVPNNFCLKLRKHLRTRRLVSVRQLGIDRVVDFEFYSSLSGNYHLIFEFYAAGNVILTDSSYKIIAMQRIVRLENEQQVQFGEMTIGMEYLVKKAQQLPEISMEYFVDFLSKQSAKDAVKKSISNLVGLGPAVGEHLTFELCKNAKNSALIADPSLLNSLFSKVSFFVNEIKRSSTFLNNAIIVTDCNGKYSEYHPFLFSFISTNNSIMYSTFNDAVDEYYYKAEQEKIERRTIEMNQSLVKKLDSIKEEQNQRIKSLQNVQIEFERNANLIKMNFSLVESIVKILQTSYDSKMEWERFDFYLKNERKRGNSIAQAIHNVNFDKKTATIVLEDFFYSPNENEQLLEEQTDSKLFEVEIEFLLSVHSNIQRYFDLKRQANDKEQRTIKANQKAIRSAEAKIKHNSKSEHIPSQIHQLRKSLWFEKFNWFISTENFLVISGKDAQQNELIVRKYLTKNDVYIHADMHGASSVVVKNSQAQPIPPSTLSQAGCMAICFSKAWDAKIVTSAWWVYEHQISKTPPTGQYLPSGSFMIRGKKNYLPPSQLVYGFGLLFKLAPESIPNHLMDRKVSTDQNDMEQLERISEKYQKMNVAVQESEEAEFPDTDLNSIIPIIPAKPTISSKTAKKEKGKATKIDIPNETIKPSKKENKRISSKLAKKKSKYQDQDEEEKEIKLALLGNKLNDKKGSRKNNSVRDITCKVTDNLKTDIVKKNTTIPNLSESKNVNVITSIIDHSDENHSKPVDDSDNEHLTDEDDDEIKKMLAEENVTVAVDGDLENVMNSLTGKPIMEDQLLFCIPVCAPYQTLRDYKYKVKLTPGTLKKGKAAKLAIHSFLASGTVEEKERGLIKAIPEMELVQCMIGKCKVSAPNIEVIKKKQKAQKASAR